MSSKKKKVEKVDFNNIKKIIIDFFVKYKYLLITDIVIFILTIFIESLYMYKVGNLLWIINTIIFIVLPTIVVTIRSDIKSKDVVISLPVFYLLFLIFINYCTMHDLYGITNKSVDILPSFIDALLVVFIFTFFQYMTVLVTNNFKALKKKKKVKKVNKTKK